jgi:hypothetical protein
LDPGRFDVDGEAPKVLAVLWDWTGDAVEEGRRCRILPLSVGGV